MKLSVIPKNSQMDYQKFRPVTITRQTNKRKTSNRKNFSDHNYNFFQNPNQQNPAIVVKINRNHKIKMYHNTLFNQYFSTTSHELHWIVAKITHFSNKIQT